MGSRKTLWPSSRLVNARCKSSKGSYITDFYCIRQQQYCKANRCAELESFFHTGNEEKRQRKGSRLTSRRRAGQVGVCLH